MAKTEKITKILLFLSLLLFPLGQFPGIILQLFFDFPFRIHILDVFVLLIALLFLIKKKPNVLKLHILFYVLLYSFILSLVKFGFTQTTIGFLYLVRLVAYLVLPLAINNSGIAQKLLQKALVFVSLVAAFLGLLQYLFLPDLRFLHLLGWDDHYYRLTFPFLDPAFTGIILVLATFYINSSTELSKTFMKTASVILTTALALTFSRASFMAFAIGLFYLQQKKVITTGKMIFLLLILVFTLFWAPKPGGEGVNLVRTNSFKQKLQNYKEGLDIIVENPLWGVGFNNLCLARPQNDQSSHACHGLDNSFLFIWATTGILGLISFLLVFYQILTKTNFGFQAIMISVLFHSLFTNTLFYNFVMFWVVLALASLKGDKLRLD